MGWLLFLHRNSHVQLEYTTGSRRVVAVVCSGSRVICLSEKKGRRVSNPSMTRKDFETRRPFFSRAAFGLVHLKLISEFSSSSAVGTLKELE